jgi:hypothetical protein
MYICIHVSIEVANMIFASDLSEHKYTSGDNIKGR